MSNEEKSFTSVGINWDNPTYGKLPSNLYK